MKIHSLHIDGFGSFADRRFGPFERSVTVFYGPNEAGKSTLLEFVRRVLFGFPDGRSRGNPYPPLAGGRLGGRITVFTDAGELVTIQRVHGRGPGTVTLSTSTGETIPVAELNSLLGNHSRSVFEHIFAFTVDELHDERLLNDNSVNLQIYSAGIGAQKLPGALDVLERQKKGLFLRTGSSHAIHEVAGKIDEVDVDLQDIAGNAAEYRRQSERLAEIERESSALSQRRLLLLAEQEGRQNLVRAWDDWNDLINAEQRLKELPVVAEFPENGIVRLEALEERADTSRREREEAVERAELIEARAVLPIDSLSILDQSDAVRHLERGRSAFDQSVKDLPEQQRELSTKRGQLKASLADLGPDWDTDRLDRFDLSVVVREEVAGYGERLREARVAVNNSQTKLTQEETGLTEARQDAERAQGDLDDSHASVLDENEILARRRQVRQSRNTLGELAHVEVRGKDLRAQIGGDVKPERTTAKRSWVTPFSALIGITGILVIVAGILLSVSGASVGGLVGALGLIVIGAILTTAAVFLFIRTHSSTQSSGYQIEARIQRQVEDADEQLADLRTQLQAESAALGLESMDADKLVEVEEALDAAQQELTAYRRLEDRLVQTRERTERQTSRRDAAEQSARDAEALLEAAEREWVRWQSERGLLAKFSPDSIQELRSLFDLASAHHSDVVAMENRIADIQTDIEKFIEITQPLATALGFDVDRDNYARVAAIADDVIELHRAVAEQSRTRDDAAKELEAYQRELARREKNQQEVADEIVELLRSGGAEDIEDFRERAQTYESRASQRATITGALEQLQRISGPDEALEALRTKLSETNVQITNDEIRQGATDLEEIDAQRSDLDAERGSIRTTLDGLLSEDDSSRLRAERHRLSEVLHGYARDWAVRTIAENLIKEAQSKFERERQPDVIRHSERFFMNVTGRSYTKVFSPLGSTEIKVTDTVGNVKTPQELSRGTREQLLLSLRFGLIMELGQRAERLPVIVDEALVNFDPSRGKKAAESFIELAQTNQVLVFTCHPQIMEWFVEAASQRGAAEPEIIRI